VRRLAVALLALAAARGTAFADAKQEAEALFRAGQQAFTSSQYNDAAEAFEQAYAKLPLPAIAFSTAQAHRLQYFIDHQPQHLKRAVELYQLYIQAQGSGGRVADATSSLAQIEPLYLQLQAAGALAGTTAAPTGKRATAVMVIADVPDARATIDGQPGTTPLTRNVALGNHVIVVEADGYEPFQRTVAALPDEMLPVEAHLVARPAHVTLAAPGGARISVDGRFAGEAPLPALDVPAGKHLFAVTDRGAEPYTREVELARGASLRIDAELPPTRQRKASRWVFVASGALAVGAGITGIAALAANSDASATLARLRAGNDPNVGDVALYNSQRTSRDDRVTATELLGGAAVAVALTGLALYLFDEPVVGGHF
jgi:hypothetical protein